MFDTVEESIASIDLIAYVPIEKPDRIDVASNEHLRLRRVVDDKLRSFVVNDDLGLGLNAVELRGSVRERALQLIEHVERSARP